MYQQGGANPNGAEGAGNADSSASDDEVTDVDFEEVNEDDEAK
jgi:hypothetical protein